jgi:hypothetical protein
LVFPATTVKTSSAAQAVTITNSGTSAVTMTSLTIGGTNSADFTGTSTCTTSLAVGASCSVSMTFKPGATGARSGTLSIADSATGSPQVVSLSGTGK